MSYLESDTYHNISIHAPAKGATNGHMYGDIGFLISIHAPAKGATHAPMYLKTYVSNFNPRSREGSDPVVLIEKIGTIRFQSTLPRRERRRVRRRTCLYANFNPRSREGSDNHDEYTNYYNKAFQSTLPRRERQRMYTLHTTRTKFQSTLPRRERPTL